ncbi:MAG: hypothetical protein JXR95_07080 [Deltaproteobacteria bacterium]|nr:hypothetical protein [Deltaproteobacteria bacterium]
MRKIFYAVLILMGCVFMSSCYEKTTCCLQDGGCEDASTDNMDADAVEDTDSDNMGG